MNVLVLPLCTVCTARPRPFPSPVRSRVPLCRGPWIIFNKIEELGVDADELPVLGVAQDHGPVGSDANKATKEVSMEHNPSVRAPQNPAQDLGPGAVFTLCGL